MFVVVLALFVIAAVASQGGDIVDPVGGLGDPRSVPLQAFAGIGFAVGGLVRSSLAAPVAAAVVIATFVLDTLGAGPGPARMRSSTCRSTSTSASRWPASFDPVGIVL